MTESQLRYEIISDARTRDEFFALIFGMNYRGHKDLDLFLKVLADLVNEDLLLCEQGRESKKSLTYNELKAYVEQRLSAGELLDEYPGICEEYLFTTTDKGLAWLDEQYNETKRRANKIVDALERHKQDHSIYPKKLEDLLNQYLDQIDPPVECHGFWRYEPYKNFTKYSFMFGADLDHGVLHSYDHKKRKWDFDEEEE